MMELEVWAERYEAWAGRFVRRVGRRGLRATPALLKERWNQLRARQVRRKQQRVTRL